MKISQIKKVVFLCSIAAPQAVLAGFISVPWILIGWIFSIFDRYCEVGQAVSRVPFSFGEYLRYFFYKYTLKRVGRKVTFKYGSYCQYRNTIIGSRVLIGAYCCLGEVNIGDDVLIGGFVNFLSGTGQHGFTDPIKKIADQPGSGRRMIRIGSDIWIGSNSVICNDIGNRCVIGVGSLVTKPVEGHGVFVGRPVRPVQKI